MTSDRRFGALRRLVRLYPRAWRERYGEEFSALLEQSDVTWRVRFDVLSGATREWVRAVVHPGRQGSPTAALLIRGFGRLAAVALLSVLLAQAVWPAARWVDAHVPWVTSIGYGSLLGMFIVARGFVAFWLVMSRAGRTRAAIGVPEFVVWTGFAFFCASLDVVHDLQVARLPFNDGIGLTPSPGDMALRLFNVLAFLVLGSRAAARDALIAEAWRARRLAMVPRDILGLRD
jgi:hypothetical protein